jgi:recombination protein RecA
MPVDERQERMKAIELAVGQIEKQFGKGSIMRLGARNAISPTEAISTGSISIDYALGIGGLPRGRVTEIFGPESSGKTTLALQVIAEAQRSGGMAAFVDAEHALDAEYAKKLGVDIDNLLVSQPDNGEQALEIVEVLVRSNSVDVVVVDSVAALVPRAEIEGEMGEAQMGLQARLMSQALRKLTGGISRSKTVLIFINQLREKIGVMFGNPETTTGGRALKFYSSIRIDIRRIGAIKDGDVATGGRTRVKVVKNKMAPPRSGVRHHVRRGRVARGRSHRSRRRTQNHREERRLVRVQRRAPRTGSRKRQSVPQGTRRHSQRHRGARASRSRLGQRARAATCLMHVATFTISRCGDVMWCLASHLHSRHHHIATFNREKDPCVVFGSPRARRRGPTAPTRLPRSTECRGRPCLLRTPARQSG